MLPCGMSSTKQCLLSSVEKASTQHWQDHYLDTQARPASVRPRSDTNSALLLLGVDQHFASSVQHTSLESLTRS